MPMTPREMIQLLQANGFVCIGSNGSHRKFWNAATKKTVIVPNVIKLSKDCHSEERSDVGIRPKNGLPRQFENWRAMTEALTK